MSDLTLADIHQSNIHVENKTGIRRFWEKAVGAGITTGNAIGHVSEVGAGLRQGGEALVVGAGLGYLNAEKGLDWGTNKDIPVDGVLAAAGLIGAVVMANHPLGIAADLRNAGSLALGILTFRKTSDWQTNRKNAATKTVSASGDFGEEDPILSMAKDFGF